MKYWNLDIGKILLHETKSVCYNFCETQLIDSFFCNLRYNASIGIAVFIFTENEFSFLIDDQYHYIMDRLEHSSNFIFMDGLGE